MSYTLSAAKAGRRALSRLPAGPAFAIVELMNGALLANPRQLGKVLQREPWAGVYSARVGPYRAPYDIDDEAGVVEVLAIGRRSTIHRP